MLGLKIELRGDHLFCRDTGVGGADTRRPLDGASLARLADWAALYDRAVTTRDWDALPPIGREIAAFLDEGDAWLSRSLAGTGELALEVVVPGTPDERGRALLDVPWELLAPKALFLAADNERLFRVERRLSPPTTPRPPAYRDLALVFMAADVEGQGALNYEHEESAILQATQRLDLNLMVEESGALDFLGETLAQERPEALHLSCHGTIARGTPVVMLETPAGGAAPTAVGDLAATLGDDDQKPALIFLSACRTAEHGAAPSAFTQALIRAGVANALGWDGSVYDADAIGFAETFYAHLARGRSVAHAAAQARRALLQKHLVDKQQGQHWHLARVYLGPAGGGPLCAPGKPKRPFRKDAGYREFLDKKNSRVPVASAAEFVGRRRQAQRILRAFRDREAAGVLVHGMGKLGKSSLAARVASRMPHHETVVLFERYDALAVFDALLRTVPPGPRPAIERTWRDAVINDKRALGGALQEMLEGSFRCEDAKTKRRPILLIIDDLEREVLTKPQPGETATPVRPGYTAVLAAIITAFAEADTTDSRLLLTSRYTFSLGDGRGGDLANRLLPVPLPPMDAVQRDKQMHAAAVLAAKAKPAGGTVDPARLAGLAGRIKDAADGNPGLQEILSRPLLKGEADAAEQALAAVEGYLATGDVPAEASVAIEFFESVSLETYRAMLTPREAVQLRVATLFSLPVPRPALHAAGMALGVAAAEAALARLEGLGLVDLYLDGNEAVEAAINPLARPLVEPLEDTDAANLAKAAIGPLYRGWKHDSGYLLADRRGLEAARLALLGEAPPEILNPAVLAGAWFLFRDALDARAALGLVEAAVAALDRLETPADLELLRVGAECADRLGESEIHERLVQQGLAIKGGHPLARARLLYAHGSWLITKGDFERAHSALQRAAASFENSGDERGLAATLGATTDILFAGGKLDEALHILREKVLPIFERLDDAHSRAVTMGRIADILLRGGKVDEALRIRTEEQLPIYEHLGDVREHAVTLRKIADILVIQDETDKALQLLTEALPLVHRLGAIRDVAVFQGCIADVLFKRGELDEALRAFREDVLPAFERIDDVHSCAVTMGKIADVLEARGELDEALRICREEVLPVYERLGDMRSRAVTMGEIADILFKRGELDEALRVHLEERLPVAEEMQDLDSIAHVRFSCASIRLQRGELAEGEAQTIADELAESFKIYRKLGRSGGIGRVGLLWAQVLAWGGHPEEALTVLEAAADAFTTLQQAENVARVRALQEQIRGGAPDIAEG